MSHLSQAARAKATDFDFVQTTSEATANTRVADAV
jgi:hypothetical protein